jgi:glycosyltransferase involved in cell wall biosynthesis
MWQKNIELALDAYRVALRAGALGSDPEPLVVAGAVDVKSRPYLAMLRDRARDLPVVFETDVTDERMVELLQSARALVFTAPNEDFGMVLLEAMACETPVIAPDRGGPQEIVVAGAGWLVPADARAVAHRMAAVRRVPPSAQEARTTRARALEFGWTRMVERVDTVMESVAAQRSP